MGRQFLPIVISLHDDLVAGVGHSVQGAISQDGVVEEAEPFLDGPVAGDEQTGAPVAADDKLVEVGGLLSDEAAEAQVCQDEETSLNLPVGAATLRGTP